MRRPATRIAFAAFVRALLVLIILAPGFESVLRSEPVREALKESEWFDYTADDYREYRPEDIELPEDNWKCRPSNEPELAVPEASAVPFFLNALVYLVLAVVAALILYLIYRVIEERRSEPELLEELIAADIQHSELPASVARTVDAREPLNQKRLRELIEAAFASEDLRSAAIYVYLFALLRLSLLGRLELAGNLTARDYSRRLAASSGPALFDFDAVARLFEFALYRGGLPADADAETLQRIWRTIDDSAAAMRKAAGGSVATGEGGA
ncbi:MAG: hypothetical protein NXI24_03625 [bacterium]|nr:hypothetical protein [bacterium]